MTDGRKSEDLLGKKRARIAYTRRSRVASTPETSGKWPSADSQEPSKKDIEHGNDPSTASETEESPAVRDPRHSGCAKPAGHSGEVRVRGVPGAAPGGRDREAEPEASGTATAPQRPRAHEDARELRLPLQPFDQPSADLRHRNLRVRRAC